MESDDDPIDPWIALRQQPWWFRLRWRFLDWRRRRALAAALSGKDRT